MLPVMLPVTLPVTLSITLSHTLTWSVPGERIPLFGLLSRSARSHEECHFCPDSIVENQIFTMETPCCGHTSHYRCFQKWVVVQSIGKYTIADSNASIQNGGAR